MKKITMLLIAASLSFAACDKQEDVIEGKSGFLRVPDDNTACDVYIQLTSGQKLYPVNHEKIEDFLIDGKAVTVSYRPTSDFVSPCSGAEPAVIENIR